MASIQRLDTTNLSSSPDVGSHRSFGGAAVLEKSHSFRESHEGGRVAGPSTSHSDALPLTSVLFLESITLPSPKSNAQLELRRVINAATGQASEDSSLGNIQSRPLENCSAEEIKRVRVGLQDNEKRARERARHCLEAVIKLDRFHNAMQSRKRNRADSGAHDRSSHGGPGPRGAGLGHVTKGSGRGASSSGEGIVSNTGIQKGSDKSKSTGISKRMRTSLADTRPEGRPSNLSVQRSSGVQERERESPRPSGLVTCSVEEKDKGTVGGGGGSVGGNEGWEKTKFKGRRSATVKAEASIVVSTMNGTADVEREQKGSSQQHRGAGDGRSRPSEGHGFRSGPVHGSLSVQKAESIVLANGSGVRGGSKVEGDGGAQSAGKADRAGLHERERSNGKGLAKPVGGRDEGRGAPSVGIVPKAKGARAPRSHLVAGGGNQAGQMGRSASFAEVREKVTVMSPVKAQVVPPSGPTNRKRAAPSRSSSPPVASWGSSRPQKKARARRANVMPPVIAIPSKEEANGVEELVGTPSSRSSPAVGGNVAKRASGGQSASQGKAQTTERLSVSVGPAVSEVCLVEDGQKIIKGRRRKQEEEEGEQKVSGTSEKSGTVVVVATSRGASVGGEENGGAGGDGVRRQGRTGRGPVTPRVVPVNSPIEKVELSPVQVKPTRVGRATVETKVAGAGRLAKNGSSDRKLSGRPRRLLNNNGTEFSGEEEDDREQLSRAVQQAVDFSALTCPNSFWRQVEPYLAYVTPDDLSLLHRHMAMADEINLTSHSQNEGAAVKSPAAGDRVSDSDEVKNWNNVREQQSAKETNFRRGRGGGWYDKVFPLSHLLLSAIISERETDDRQKISDEFCADRDSDSPMHLSNHSEMDYDRRDAEGESDVENLKPESEWWSAEVKEGGYGKGSPMSGGQGGRLWAEDQDGDDILVRSSSPQSSGADMDNGGEVHVMDSQAGFGRQLGNGLMEWDEQYRRMSLDDRLSLELSSIGLLPGQAAEHHEQEVDDIGDELRRLQTEFAEQVSRNKEHLCRLESTVIEKRPLEERAREKLAMDKLVELAYKKRSGGRSKGAAGKVAKAAALAFATRVLARVHDYEAGHSCITDPALRDRLFCVPPSLVESTPDAAMDAGAIATTAERITSPTGGGMLVGQRMEEAEKPFINGQTSAMDYNRLKQEAWASRGRDREAFFEDVSGYTTTRDVNTLSSNGLGGIKGKRSERDTKGAGAPARPGPSNAKGERKTKTKPRQKTGPVLKPVQGLVARAADLQSGKDRSLNHEGYGATRREESMPGLPVFQDMQQQPEANGPLDLAGVPLPGMEDMNMVDQADIGSWLDFNLDDPIQSTDDGLMGLDIPMDDLSGLMMI